MKKSAVHPFIFLFIVLFVVGCSAKPATPPQEQSQKQDDSALKVSMSQSTADVDKIIKVAEDQLMKGNLVDSIKTLQQEIVKHPNEAKPYFLLGQIYMHTGNAKDAMESFKRFIQLNPENGEGYLLLGGCHDMLGEKEAAIESVKKSVELFQKQRDSSNFVKAASILRAMMQAEEAAPAGK